MLACSSRRCGRLRWAGSRRAWFARLHTVSDMVHGASHGYAHQLRFAFVAWQDDGQPEAGQRLQEQAVEPVFEVELGGLGWAELGVCVADEPEDSGQGASELHCFRRGVGDG